MIIRLEPIKDNRREAVPALTVRGDQLFVAPNDVSPRQAEETNDCYWLRRFTIDKNAKD